MRNRRCEEEARTWFRSDRFFRSNDNWYFHTREGTAVGPYRSRFDAEIDAGRLLALLRDKAVGLWPAPADTPPPDAVRGQRPRNCGVRLSAKARRPSL